MSGPSRGSAVAKVRVYELAKEFGVESKAVMAELEKMGEFVRSASSTIEAPVVRRLKNTFNGGTPKPSGGGGGGDRSPAPRPGPMPGGRPQGGRDLGRGPETGSQGDGRRGDGGQIRVPNNGAP